MRRVVYASRALRDFTDEDLLDLLKRARGVNEALGVTGMLVYSSRSFLQVFEGEDDDVDQVWRRIRLDDRHTDVRLLRDQQVHQRGFGSWSMGFWHPDSADLELSFPGYRASLDYPFVSSDLVADGDTAETLLSLYARRSA